MIYSGLDWSGSPGREGGPYIVTVVVQVDGDLRVVEAELNQAAQRLRWDRRNVFKHLKATQEVHGEFYRALAGIPFSAYAHMLDKAAWHAQYGGKGSDGNDCICDSMTTVLLRCPPETTADQILYIDLPHSERTVITRYREVIRAALKGADRRTFRAIKARPDNRRDGGIVQIADMLAGEVAQHHGLNGPYLPGLKSRITLV